MEQVFRSGDRGAADARALKLTPGFVATAEGSVLIEVGHTRVLCNATIENGVPGWMRNSGRGWVTAEYGMLPRATLTRSPREAEKGKIGGRDARDPTADRAEPAGRGRYEAAGRADGDPGLRCAAGRWRDADGCDHRRLRGTGDCAGPAGGCGDAEGESR